MPPNMHLETSALQGMGPVQEAPVTEAWIPQAGPQELNYGATGECQPFLDPGKEGFSFCSFVCDRALESSQRLGWLETWIPRWVQPSWIQSRGRIRRCVSGNSRERCTVGRVALGRGKTNDPAH